MQCEAGSLPRRASSRFSLHNSGEPVATWILLIYELVSSADLTRWEDLSVLVDRQGEAHGTGERRRCQLIGLQQCPQSGQLRCSFDPLTWLTVRMCPTLSTEKHIILF